MNYSNNMYNYDRGYIVFLKILARIFEWYQSQIVTDFVGAQTALLIERR